VRRTLVALAILAAPAIASASPNDILARSLVLDPGGVAARVEVEFDLKAGRFATPLSIAPDLWLGVTSRLTLGLVHSSESVDLIDDRASFCFRGDALSCDRSYRGSGLDARWSWLEGPLAVAPRARFLVRDIDPWKPAVTAGALVRWTQGRYAITSDPYLRVGLVNRDLGNRTALVVPIWFAIQPTWRSAIALHTGWDGDLATWRDGWHVPIALELVARATRRVDLGLTAGFPHLLGPQNTPKERAMSLMLEVRP
jgi:hypothetical protein